MIWRFSCFFGVPLLLPFSSTDNMSAWLLCYQWFVPTYMNLGFVLPTVCEYLPVSFDLCVCECVCYLVAIFIFAWHSEKFKINSVLYPSFETLWRHLIPLHKRIFVLSVCMQWKKYWLIFFKTDHLRIKMSGFWTIQWSLELSLTEITALS